MAATPRPIKCKSCDRILATVSPKGLVPAEGAESQGCDTCQHFQALYDAMQIADEEYAPLDQKGDRHRGKQFAVAKVKKTHMDFDNWLIGVEAPVNQNVEHQDDDDMDSREEGEAPKHGVEKQQSRNRALSYSPITHQSGVNDTQYEALLDGQSQQEQQTLSIPHRPSSKRSRSTASLPERKRLKFSDSVEFRDDYRNYLMLGRSSASYVPGRYAPPEGGYLDTSGSEQSFPKFTGLKKVRGAWVEVKEKDNKSGSKAVKMAAEVRRLGDSNDKTAQERKSDLAHEAIPEGKTELDSRSVRLLRRSRRSSSVEAAQQKDNAESATTATTQKRRGKSPKRESEETPDPVSDGVMNQSTSEAEREDHNPVWLATSAIHDPRASEQTSDGDIEEDQSRAVGVTCNDETKAKR
ncbi:Nn.00g037140.m01.CDS01 [Neocucurbitaria sp. VM-36]